MDLRRFLCLRLFATGHLEMHLTAHYFDKFCDSGSQSSNLELNAKVKSHNATPLVHLFTGFWGINFVF